MKTLPVGGQTGRKDNYEVQKLLEGICGAGWQGHLHDADNLWILIHDTDLKGRNTMEYTISFAALKTTGEVVDTRTFHITTDYPLDLTNKKKVMCLDRFLVEYARLTGLKCSDAKIIEINGKVK